MNLTETLRYDITQINTIEASIISIPDILNNGTNLQSRGYTPA